MAEESWRSVLIRFGIGFGSVITILAILEAGKEFASIVGHSVPSIWYQPVSVALFLSLAFIALCHPAIYQKGYADYLAGGITFFVTLIPAFLAAFLTSQQSGYNWALGTGVGLVFALASLLVWLGLRPQKSPAESVSQSETS